MVKKNILIISYSRLDSDPRVYRQIVSLKQDYQVTAAGICSPGLSDVEFIEITERRRSLISKVNRMILLKIRQYDSYYKKTFNFEELQDRVRKVHYDLIIANDVDSLQAAFSISDGTNIIHDAHEYAPKQQDENLSWRFFMMRYREYLCRKYLPRCKAVITVSDGIAREYEDQYGVRPEVITNATEFVNIEPSPVQNNLVRIIHHGSANKARHIEKMIEVMEHLGSKYSLDLMLLANDKRYLQFLRKRAEGLDNVRFRNPVPMKDIISASNEYDIGLYLFEPTNFNHQFALPNKLFEFIQARLAVAIGPSPEMAKIVKKYDCGVVARDFRPESIADEIRSLSKERLSYYKSQSAIAAHEMNSERNIEFLKQIVRKCLTP
jgi:glycosyltransferase involved in cell wall biosynthesis